MFSLTFPVLCTFTFRIFWELCGFLFLPKYLRNPYLWNVCVFSYFSRIMGIHFSQVLGIVWISASYEIFKKPINLKCLCFSILFPYNGNLLFACFGTAWISASSEKFQKHLTLKCLCFLSLFPYYGNSLFPYFGNCMDFFFTQNI